MSPFVTYLLVFAASLWQQLWSIPIDRYRHREMVAITADIASTDADALEALKLENIVSQETGWQRNVVGRHGELGAFQLMPFPWTTAAEKREWKARGAREALRRLRKQGITGYCGCARACPKTVARRVDAAILFRLAFDPPAEQDEPVVVAREP